MDARGCQGELARQIVDHEGANVLSLKENQLGSPRDGAELFAWFRDPHPMEQEVVLGYDTQVDGGYGRREVRKVRNTEALAGLGTCERWPGLAMVECTQQGADKHVGNDGIPLARSQALQYR